MTPQAVSYVCLDPGVPVFGRKGCSVHVQEVLRDLVRRGAAVDLLATRTGGSAPRGLGAVPVHELGRPGGYDDAARERALVDLDRRAAAAVGSRLVQARAARGGRGLRPVVYQRYSLWSCAVLERARAAGAATVLEVNAPLVQEQARHRVLVDERTAVERTARALRAAHLAYAVSEPVARWARDLAGVDVAVLPNGVDPARFAVGPRDAGDADAGAWSGRTAGAGRPLVVAFVGTFRPWHGTGVLLDALARLGARPPAGLPPLRLLLVGDGPCREATVRRAAELGVDVRDTGPVPPDAVPGLLAGADVAVAPYPAGDAYFSPLKVMEYLAAGLPTVAGAVTDLPRLFADGSELLLVPPGDAGALAAALHRLRADAGLRERLGRAGAAAVRDRHTWSAVVDEVLQRATLAADAVAVAA